MYDVVFGLLSLVFTAFSFQFCLRDTDSHDKKKQETFRYARNDVLFCFFLASVHGKSPYVLSR